MEGRGEVGIEREREIKVSAGTRGEGGEKVGENSFWAREQSKSS